MTEYRNRLEILALELRKLKIFKKDMLEVFTHSSGPGGQNVNKVATCVQLTHVLTGISVKAQKFRTQIANRIYARELLRDKIIEQRAQKVKQEKFLKEKLKRQNRKRSKYSKERMLENKRKNAQKKDLRKKINPKFLD